MCSFNSSLSISRVRSVLAPLESSVTSTAESACWWHKLLFGELGRVFCQPLKTFVSILIETGLYNLRNLLRISLCEPSILTTNWSCGSTSITALHASHLRGWAPLWFCSKHLMLTYRGCKFLDRTSYMIDRLCIFNECCTKFLCSLYRTHSRARKLILFF